MLILVFSFFLPILSSSSEAVPFSENNAELREDREGGHTGLKRGLQGSVEEVKKVQPADIWHAEVDYSEVGNPGKEPFETKEATVKINMTGCGRPNETVNPFDWIFSMDTSGSMDGPPLQNSIDGAQYFVDLVEEDVNGSRGATIEFDDTAQLVNDRSFTDDYDAVRSDLETLVAGGGTSFSPPLARALEEFEQEGVPSRSWFHLFLTDGEGSIDWDLIDEHAAKDIPIYTIGFGNINETLLQEMADRTGGEFHEAENSSDLEKVFQSIFEEITSLNEKAVESPENEAMVREVLPPHLEYVEGSAAPQENFTWWMEGDKTYLEWDKDGLYINETWEVEYKVRASKYGHGLPITAYDDAGEPLSRISYRNISSGEIERIYNPGPEVGVHGPPEPVLGPSEWGEVKVGEPVVFENRSGDEMSSWPGDCKVVKYKWDFGDGETYSESEGEENFNGTSKPHEYDSPGTYEVTLEATTIDGVYAITEPKSITVTELEPPSVVITRPEDGETWYAGDEEEITWETTEGDAPLTTVDLEYSTNDGETWENIAADLDDTGSYSWTVAEDPTDEARIRAKVVDENEKTGTDRSSRFTITGVMRLEIDPEEHRIIQAGETIDFEARAYDFEDDVLEDDDLEFTWSYAGETGLFDETKAGEYQVTATFKGVTSPATTVTVEPAEADGVQITPRQDKTIKAGETIDFEAKSYDEYYNLIEDDDSEFRWKN
ncbi:MAG: PKD domain-containing protein, partial [Candidatus Thermoplasmatota archaeon]